MTIMMRDKLLEILGLEISDSDKVKLIEEAYKASSLAPLEDRKEVFRKKVWSWYFKNGKGVYESKDIELFLSVWNVLSPDGKLLKFERENKFQIAGRLKMFKKQDEKYTDLKRIQQFRSKLGNVNPLR